MTAPDNRGDVLPVHRRMWRAWRGWLGDDIIWLVGAAALVAHVVSHDDTLPIAVLACMLLLGRQSDRSKTSGGVS